MSSSCPSRSEFPLIETEDKALLRRLRGREFHLILLVHHFLVLPLHVLFSLPSTCSFHGPPTDVCLLSRHTAEGPWGSGAPAGAGHSVFRPGRGDVQGGIRRRGFRNQHLVLQQEPVQSWHSSRSSGWATAHRCHQWRWRSIDLKRTFAASPIKCLVCFSGQTVWAAVRLHRPESSCKPQQPDSFCNPWQPDTQQWVLCHLLDQNFESEQFHRPYRFIFCRKYTCISVYI